MDVGTIKALFRLEDRGAHGSGRTWALDFNIRAGLEHQNLARLIYGTRLD